MLENFSSHCPRHNFKNDELWHWQPLPYAYSHYGTAHFATPPLCHFQFQVLRISNPAIQTHCMLSHSLILNSAQRSAFVRSSDHHVWMLTGITLILSESQLTFASDSSAIKELFRRPLSSFFTSPRPKLYLTHQLIQFDELFVRCGRERWKARGQNAR